MNPQLPLNGMLNDDFTALNWTLAMSAWCSASVLVLLERIEHIVVLI
jgi:hypothetical protein